MANQSKSSRKHSRNRVGRSSAAKSVYIQSGGEDRHAAKAARNCGCDKPVNHTRKNRTGHEQERQLKARAARIERTALPAAA